jgi:NAD(P)-dependent dehydrogenase (short-subunit alcohol dehydrogenase family)
MRHRFDLVGEIAVVTGAASGIGRAIAASFAAAGARVAAVGNHRDSLDTTCAELRQQGLELHPYVADVTSPAALRDVAAAVARDLGPVGVLAANAGINRPAAALDVTEADWDAVTAVNLKGVFFTCQAFGATMVAQRRGAIVITGSTFAMVGFPDRAPYAAGKAGAVHLARALATEWGPHGVRVNAVCPTVTRTALVAPLMTDPGYSQRMLSHIPLGRIAEPEDVAAAALFLASPAAAMVTGHALMVDGGWTCH